MLEPQPSDCVLILVRSQGTAYKASIPLSKLLERRTKDGAYGLQIAVEGLARGAVKLIADHYPEEDDDGPARGEAHAGPSRIEDGRGGGSNSGGNHHSSNGQS